MSHSCLPRQFASRARVLAFAAAVLVAAGLVSPSGIATAGAQVEASVAGTPVMGPNILSARQLASWYYAKKGHDYAQVPALDDDIERLAAVFIAEGRKDGVRGDIAFVQSMVETGWLGFASYGQIRPTFNNFAGLYAYDGRPKGTTCAAETAPSRCFATPDIGVRTQIHLLRSYADPSIADATGRLARAPADRRGIAPYWEQFGYKPPAPLIWASARDYGTVVLSVYKGALAHNGVTAPCFPIGQSTDGTAGDGYWSIGATGRSYAFGTAPALGGGDALGASSAVVDAAATPSGDGYWLATRGGGAYGFGDAGRHGSLGQANLATATVGIAASGSGRGYWLATEDGGVFPFGDAPELGSLANTALGSPIVAIERTVSGAGYWLLSAAGDVYAFGDAGDFGSPRARGVTTALAGLARTPTGNGYYAVSKYGRVYAFGDAVRTGDVFGCGFGTAAEIVAAPTGTGYWVATSAGNIVAFGSAQGLGMPNAPAGGAVALVLSA